MKDTDEREHAETRRIIADGASDREVIEALVAQHTSNLARERHWLSLVVAASEPSHPAHEYFRQRHDQLRLQVEAFAKDPAARTIGQYDPDTRAPFTWLSWTDSAYSGSSTRRSTWSPPRVGSPT